MSNSNDHRDVSLRGSQHRPGSATGGVFLRRADNYVLLLLRNELLNVSHDMWACILCIEYASQLTGAHGRRLGQGVKEGLDLRQAGQLKRWQRVTAAAAAGGWLLLSLQLRSIGGAVI